MSPRISPAPFAVIFDMDGVICDTEPFHGRIEHQMFLQYGIDISAEEMVHRFAGGSFIAQVKALFAEHNVPLPEPQKLYEEKTQLLMETLREGLPEIPGTRELIISLYAAAVPLAIASGSPPAFIDFVMNTLRLQTYFPVIASADEVEQGKPAPDVFLLAAKRLGTDPSRCVVIEDSMNGMRAAKAAGMKCIGYVQHPSGEEVADLIVKDIRQIDAGIIKAL